MMEHNNDAYRSLAVAAALFSLPAAAQIPNKGKSGTAPGRDDATPGQQQLTPGEAKDLAPGRKQGTDPGSAKSINPGSKQRKTN